MVRKTLSVGPDTWKALSALGRFGMSFDDIVKILLREHNELMRMKGEKEIPLAPSIFELSQEAKDQMEAQAQLQQQFGTQPQARSQPQPQPQEKVSLEYSLLLPGLKFPANKDEIKECAKKVKYPEQATMTITHYILGRLPSHEYTSKNKLEQDFSFILKKMTKDHGGRVVTIVYTEPIDPERIEKAVLINTRIAKNVNTKLIN